MAESENLDERDDVGSEAYWHAVTDRYEADLAHERQFRDAITKALSTPDGGRYLNDALERIDSLTSELAEARGRLALNDEINSRLVTATEFNTLRQRAERYEKALQEVAAASIAVVSADELQDIAAAALQDPKEAA